MENDAVFWTLLGKSDYGKSPAEKIEKEHQEW